MKLEEMKLVFALAYVLVNMIHRPEGSRNPILGGSRIG